MSLYYPKAYNLHGSDKALLRVGNQLRQLMLSHDIPCNTNSLCDLMNVMGSMCTFKEIMHAVDCHVQGSRYTKRRDKWVADHASLPTKKSMGTPVKPVKENFMHVPYYTLGHDRDTKAKYPDKESVDDAYYLIRTLVGYNEPERYELAPTPAPLVWNENGEEDFKKASAKYDKDYAHWMNLHADIEEAFNSTGPIQRLDCLYYLLDSVLTLVSDCRSILTKDEVLDPSKFNTEALMSIRDRYFPYTAHSTRYVLSDHDIFEVLLWAERLGPDFQTTKILDRFNRRDVLRVGRDLTTTSGTQSDEDFLVYPYDRSAYWASMVKRGKVSLSELMDEL
jgi:hypothetical protein